MRGEPGDYLAWSATSTTTPTRHMAPTTESPCIKVCQLDLDNRCRGCGRMLDEIARWRDMTSEERIAVNERLGFRSHERRER